MMSAENILNWEGSNLLEDKNLSPDEICNWANRKVELLITENEMFQGNCTDAYFEQVLFHIKRLSTSESVVEFSEERVWSAVRTLVKLFRASCSSGNFSKLPWCNVTLGNVLAPVIMSPNCAVSLTAAAAFMTGEYGLKHDYLTIMCASYQFAQNTGISADLIRVSKLWLSNGACEVLGDLFDAACPVETRKLAWDLAYLLVTCVINPAQPSFGFRLDAKTPDSELIWEIDSVIIMLKLLNSFLVTFPAHFPFMPTEYYEPVKWPLDNSEMCHGKVQSLFSYIYEADKDHSASFRSLVRAQDEGQNTPFAERSSSPSEEACVTDVKLKEPTPPGSGVCLWEPSRKRQPWVGKFSFLCMFGLYKQLLRHQGKCSSAAACRSFAIAVELLRSTLLLIYNTDSKLCKREKASEFRPDHNASSCECCSKKFTILSIFSIDQRRHHCRLCQKTMCGKCTVEKYWNDEKCCVECQFVLDDIGFLRPFERANSVYDDISEQRLCCSVYMEDGLRDWRDNAEFDASDFVLLK